MISLPDRGHRHPRRHVPRRGQPLHARGGRRCHRRRGRACCPAGRASSTSSATSTTRPSRWPTSPGSKKHFGGLEALRGKKIAMTWAYCPSYGKPLSVPQGIIGLMTRFGMDVSLAHPEGYGLIPEVVEVAEEERRRERRSVRGRRTAWKRPSRRRRRVPEVLGALPGHAAPDRASEEDRTRRAWRRSRRSAWRTTRSSRLGVRPGEDEADRRARRRSTCTACRPTSPASAARRARCRPRSSTQYRIPTYHEAAYKPFVIAALMFLDARSKDPSARKLRASIVESRAPRTLSRPEESTRHVCDLVNPSESIRRPGSHRATRRSAASRTWRSSSPPSAQLREPASRPRPSCATGEARMGVGLVGREPAEPLPDHLEERPRRPGSSAAQPPRDPAESPASRRGSSAWSASTSRPAPTRSAPPSAAWCRAWSSGEFDPEKHKAVWPTTGNYCRGGAFDCAMLGCTAVAILPENMSQERFAWLAAHRRRSHRHAGLRDQRQGDLRQVLGAEEGPAAHDLQPVRGVRQPDLALQRHRPGHRGGLPRPRGEKAPPRRLCERHRQRRHHRRRRLPEDDPRREDRRHRGAAVPDPVHERLRRPPDRGHRRQARAVGPQRPQHRRRGRHRRRGLHAGAAALQRAGGPGVPRAAGVRPRMPSPSSASSASAASATCWPPSRPRSTGSSTRTT